jgi:hypothetical protein
MQATRGMVLVNGATYRIARLGDRHYEVVRVHDDTRVGTFRTGPRLEVFAEKIDGETMLLVARAAVRQARTSWVGRLSLR